MELENFYKTSLGFYFQVSLDRGEAFIPTQSEREADSKRVAMFNARRKLPLFMQNSFGIRKENIGGSWFVVIRKQESPPVFVMQNGELVSLEIPPAPVEELSPEQRDRMVKAMREDGMSEEEIKAYFGPEQYQEVS